MAPTPNSGTKQQFTKCECLSTDIDVKHVQSWRNAAPQTDLHWRECDHRKQCVRSSILFHVLFFFKSIFQLFSSTCKYVYIYIYICMCVYPYEKFLNQSPFLFWLNPKCCSTFISNVHLLLSWFVSLFLFQIQIVTLLLILIVASESLLFHPNP